MGFGIGGVWGFTCDLGLMVWCFAFVDLFRFRVVCVTVFCGGVGYGVIVDFVLVRSVGYCD